MIDIRDTRTLTLEGALRVLNAAITEATRIGQPMCIAVVDSGGNLLSGECASLNTTALVFT